MVPENIHTPTREGFFQFDPPPHWIFRSRGNLPLSHPPTLGISVTLRWGGGGGVWIFSGTTQFTKPQIQIIVIIYYYEYLLSISHTQQFMYRPSVDLLDRILGSEDKGVCTRALWCLAKQNLDSAVINSQVCAIKCM